MVLAEQVLGAQHRTVARGLILQFKGNKGRGGNRDLAAVVQLAALHLAICTNH